MHITDDKDRGLYEKYIVNRMDGSSAAGGKHHGCEYFVLDLTHDPFSRDALIAYALACREKFPLLSEDLMNAAHKPVKKPNA